MRESLNIGDAVVVISSGKLGTIKDYNARGFIIEHNGWTQLVDRNDLRHAQPCDREKSDPLKAFLTRSRGGA